MNIANGILSEVLPNLLTIFKWNVSWSNNLL
jgi:hypothetical protein